MDNEDLSETRGKVLLFRIHVCEVCCSQSVRAVNPRKSALLIPCALATSVRSRGYDLARKKEVIQGPLLAPRDYSHHCSVRSVMANNRKDFNVSRDLTSNKLLSIHEVADELI